MVNNMLQRGFVGIRWGLKVAGVYCAYVIVLYILTGGNAFMEIGVSLPTVLVVYLLGGVVGGGLVGVLLPIAQSSLLGAMAIGILGMAPIITGAVITVYGVPPWKSNAMRPIIGLSIMLGSYGGYLLRVLLERRAKRERGELTSER